MVTLTAQAVTLEGHRALGDPAAVNSILSGRMKDAKAWAETLARLETIRANTSDAADRLRQDAMTWKRRRRRTVSLVMRRAGLLYRIPVAGRSGEDRRDTFEGLVRHAQRHLEAAQRFSKLTTPSSDPHR